MTNLSPALLGAILEQYKLPWYGTHGLCHWGRVLENGRRLARYTGADLAVVELFAVFHDSGRLNENMDPGHGLRAAMLAEKLRGEYFSLSDPSFALLHYACAAHTDGLTEADLTVQVCWDADRLDLGRVGIDPHCERLCTSAACEGDVLDWASRRSSVRDRPVLLMEEWGLEPPPARIQTED